MKYRLKQEIPEKIRFQLASLSPDQYLLYDKETGDGYPIKRDWLEWSPVLKMILNRQSVKIPSIPIALPRKVIENVFSVAQLSHKSDGKEEVAEFCKNLSRKAFADLISGIDFLGISLNNNYLIYQKNTNDVVIMPEASVSKKPIEQTSIIEIKYPVALFKEANELYKNCDSASLLELFWKNKSIEKNVNIINALYSDKKNADFNQDDDTSCRKKIKESFQKYIFSFLLKFMLLSVEVVKLTYYDKSVGGQIYDIKHNEVKYEISQSLDILYSMLRDNVLEKLNKNIMEEVWDNFKSQGILLLKVGGFSDLMSNSEKSYIESRIKNSETLSEFLIAGRDIVKIALVARENRDKNIYQWKYWFAASIYKWLQGLSFLQGLRSKNG